MGLDNDDIKQLIAILQKGLSDDSEPAQPNNKKPKKRVAKTKKTPTRPNKFEEMSEFRMHKDDTLIDKKLQKIPPVPRNRDYKPINIRCRICGKQENVNPSLVESSERYKCNRCSTSSG